MMYRLFAAHAAALTAVFGILSASVAPVAAQDTPSSTPTHAMIMHGEPLYGPDFSHFGYADPDAPTGGEISYGVVGAYDSLNPFIVRGRTAAGIRPYTFASMLARSWDEPFSLYGYVAERIDLADDRRSVTFHLNPAAAFHDGTPITSADVVATVETLRSEGLPGFRRNYALIDTIDTPDAHTVTFHLGDAAGRETPMILGLMPIMSSADLAGRTFNETTLEPMLGSGPYRVAEVDPGQRIVYERVDGWWAADLPAFRGQNRLDRIRYDYFLDPAVAFEAFRAGQYSMRRESDGVAWASDYDFPAVQAGDVTLLELPHHRPSGLRGFVFNTRRPPFDDRTVRRALSMGFDSAFVSETLLRGGYDRIQGLFTNSPLQPSGPPSDAELALLAPWRDVLPEAVFGDAFVAEGTENRGLRAALRDARNLLADAGWTVVDGALTSPEGDPLTFQILLRSPADEPVALAYADSLRRIGIEVSVRLVDSAQYAQRLDVFDFDVVIHRWNVTLSPGAEQHLYWGSASASLDGTQNLPGVASPTVDALIGALENAADYDDLTAAARALDRVLMWDYYVVPLFYLNTDYIASWGRYGRVEDVDPLYGTVVEAWWAAAE